MLRRNPYGDDDEVIDEPIPAEAQAPGPVTDIPIPDGYRGWPELPNGLPGRAATPPASTGNRFNISPYKGAPVDYGDYAGPAPFAYKDYTPLTSDTFHADPGYEFRRDEGGRAIRYNASAEGLSRSTGAIKSLMGYNSGLASQEFGNVEARNFRNWDSGRATAKDSYDSLVKNSLAEYESKVGRSRDIYGRGRDEWQFNTMQSNEFLGQLMQLAKLFTPEAPAF